jgi:hypothetical protein
LLVSKKPQVKVAKETTGMKDTLLAQETDEITLKEGLKSYKFLGIALMFCFGTFFGLYIASTYKTHADTQYVSDS